MVLNIIKVHKHDWMLSQIKTNYTYIHLPFLKIFVSDC